MKKAIYYSLAVCVVLVLPLVFGKAQNAGVGFRSAVRPADLPLPVDLTRDLTIVYEVQTLAYGKRMQKRRDTVISRPNGDTAGMSDTLDGGFIGSFHKMGSGKYVVYDTKSRVAFEESLPELERRPRINGRDICGKYTCSYKTVKAVLTRITNIDRVGETSVITLAGS